MHIQQGNQPAKRRAPHAGDVHAIQRARKRKRHLRRAVIFFFIAALVLVLYQQRDVWIPKLEDLSFGTQPVVQNDGSISDGKFPLAIYGGKEYQTAQIGDLMAILSDSYLYLYQTDGTLAGRRQHAYGSAMLKTAGSYALIYESGGTNFRLDTAARSVFEKTVSEPIIFGRVSDTGMTAVVTGSDTSACKLLIFNKKGKQIYARSCIEELAEVAFRKDSTGCYAVNLRPEEGTLKSVVHNYDFTQKDALWTSEPLDTLCISVYNTNGDGLCILGDTSCIYLDAQGSILSAYSYPDTLVCGDSADGVSAVLLRNDEKRTNSVVLLNGTADTPCVLDVEHDVKYVRVGTAGTGVTIQTRTSLESFDTTGCRIAQTPISDTYDRFLPIQSYLFLMGYDRIDRVEYAVQE